MHCTHICPSPLHREQAFALLATSLPLFVKICRVNGCIFSALSFCSIHCNLLLPLCSAETVGLANPWTNTLPKPRASLDLRSLFPKLVATKDPWSVCLVTVLPTQHFTLFLLLPCQAQEPSPDTQTVERRPNIVSALSLGHVS